MARRKGKKSVTIRDVARAANVSVATVSRYINGTAPVSKQVAERLEKVMAELNYIPHATARRLATNRTYTIGLLLTDISGDFFAPLLSGVDMAVRERGYDLLISSTRESAQKVTDLPVGPHNSDGVLVFATSMGEECLRALARQGFPMVLIHRTPPAGVEMPCVTVENKAASFDIVKHLIDVHGRRRIVFLRGPQDHEDSYWRERGYREALEASGIEVDPALITSGGFYRRTAYASIKALLAEGIPFDGVFSGDDEAAVGVLIALKEAGLRVPEDVSVVGFDDQRMSPYLSPPLTTVRAPTREVGRVATHHLIDLIEGKEVPPLTLLPTEIVIRHSCGCRPNTPIIGEENL